MNIYSLIISSPIGEIIAYSSQKGICFLGFLNQKHFQKHTSDIEKHYDTQITPNTNTHLEVLKNDLHENFLGTRKNFTVPLDIIGTDFRKKVWKALQSIPYGKTCTYKEQAISIKNLKAIRAVASSNGANKMAIIIPCHRVIGSDGSVTGYAGGIEKKEWLLDFESKNSIQ